MPNLQWALICQRVITDRDSNSVSYIEAVEELTLPALPFPFPPVYVCTLWRRTAPAEPIRFRILVVAPSGAELTQFSSDVQEERQALRHRVNVLFGGFTVADVGPHTISVEEYRDGDWRLAAQFFVDVQLAPASGAA